MRLLSLGCQQFRNLQQVRFEPHPRFNVIEGDNGQGKTNLLEAIYLAATFRSFRDAKSSELIGWGEDLARIEARCERRGVERSIAIELSRKGKRVALDGKIARSLTATTWPFAVVVFGPDHLALTKQGPDARRRFLDRAVFNVWPAYLDEARAYHAALSSRNKLLRQGLASPIDPIYLASFDEELCMRAGRVLWRRLQLVVSLRPLLQTVLSEISGGALLGDLRYAGPGALSEDSEEEQLRERMREALERTAAVDRRRGFTSAGPHTGELHFSIADRSVRAFASQGQHRAFVLALKMAELQRIEAAAGAAPVLLLDDVSSELDKTRNGQLVSFLDARGGQVFATTTDRAWLDVSSQSQVYRVRSGSIEQA